MFGCLGKGPDPGGMTCAEIVKGYKKNQELAETRSSKHRQQHRVRVQELKPFYERCIQQEAELPVLQQGAEIQAVFDQIYEGGEGAPGVSPLSMSATGRAQPSPVNVKSLLMLAGLGVGAIVVLMVMKRRSQ